MNCDLDSSLPEWLLEHPESESILAELGLDLTCGGKSLRYQCLHGGFDPHEILRRLRLQIRELKVNGPRIEAEISSVFSPLEEQVPPPH